MSTRVQHIRGTTAEVEAATPLVAELGFDTTKKEAHLGDGSTAGGIRLPKKNIVEILAPAQITATANDYSPSGMKHAATLIVTTNASRDITGMVPTTVTDATDGREITLYNGGSFNAVLKDQNAGSSANNRFDLGGSDLTLQPKNSVTLRYRTTGALNRWEIVARTDGVTPADGSVLARKLATSSFGGCPGMVNGTIVESRAGGAATFAIKTLAGTDPSAADPVYFIFRDVTAANGNFVVRTVTAALALTVSSGSSLGFTNSVPGKIWLTAIDNAGTVLLGVINTLSGLNIYPLSGFGIVTTVAEGGAGAADSTQVMYAASAVTKPYALLGYAAYETGLAAAGTWSAAPTRLQLFGPGVPLPGQVIGNARVDNGTVANGTTVMPNDNTIPQNTEGDQCMVTPAYTPSSACHLGRVRAQLQVYINATATATAALFRDSVANAFAASSAIVATQSCVLALAAAFQFGATTSTQVKARAGTGTGATTMTFNGAAGSQLFGGVANSFIDLEEIAT